MPAATMQLPVSTTHSIVGAIVGMSVTAEGFDSVVWYKHKSTFPYVDGVVGIVSSREETRFSLCCRSPVSALQVLQMPHCCCCSFSCCRCFPGSSPPSCPPLLP